MQSLVWVSTICVRLSVRMLGVSTGDQTNLLFRLAYQVLCSHLLPAHVPSECWTCRVGLQQTSCAILILVLTVCMGLSVLMLDVNPAN